MTDGPGTRPIPPFFIIDNDTSFSIRMQKDLGNALTQLYTIDGIKGVIFDGSQQVVGYPETYTVQIEKDCTEARASMKDAITRVVTDILADLQPTPVALTIIIDCVDTNPVDAITAWLRLNGLKFHLTPSDSTIEVLDNTMGMELALSFIAQVNNELPNEAFSVYGSRRQTIIVRDEKTEIG